MLIIEMNKKMEKCWKVVKGTYKINSKLINGINICESLSEHTLYSGYIDIEDDSQVEIIKYDIFSTEISKLEYLEYILPTSKYENSWTDLIYDEKFKYQAFMQFSKSFNSNKEIGKIFGINRCMLIYGEPGVGKTTFSKALCQKLAIRNNKPITVREIKSSRIFSRFYGESMHNLEEMLYIEDKNMVIILDEADSVLLNRSSTIIKNEPNDSLRIVNTLLSIIDRQESYIILISNFKDQLDPAILDRCDFLIEMNSLSIQFTYDLIKSILEKMMELGYLEHYQFIEYLSLQLCGSMLDENSWQLKKIAEKYANHSPRHIKKQIFQIFNIRKQPIRQFLKILAEF